MVQYCEAYMSLENFSRALIALLIAAACAATGTPSSHAQEVSTVHGNLLAPKAFRAAATAVRPSVVSIETFGGVATGGSSRGAGASFKPGEGPTTGLVISSDGYVISSTFNFLDRPPIITVVFSDGQRKVARLLGRDDTRKLCLLKIEGVSGLPVPEFAPLDQLKVGQWAVALGVGFGEEEPALSAGIISALNRISSRAVQTDANLSPANYGGPLIDIEGRVIGICVPLSPGSKETAAGAEWYDSGIGFAVPLSGLESIIGQLKEGKELKPGYLGVQAGPYGEPPSGVEIKKVLPGSAAEKGGLKDGDRILQLGDEPVIDTAHLTVLVNRHVLGDTVPLKVQRGEEQLTIEVTLGEMPAPMPMVVPGAPKSDEEKPEGVKPEGEKPGGEKPADEPADDDQPQ
jgi:serine protease Do